MIKIQFQDILSSDIFIQKDNKNILFIDDKYYQNTTKNILLLFTINNCPSCDKFKQILENINNNTNDEKELLVLVLNIMHDLSLQQSQNFYEKLKKIESINFEENEYIAETLEIYGAPTFFMLQKSNDLEYKYQVVNSSTGCLSYEQTIEFIK